MIPVEHYKEIVGLLPILCVDVIVENPVGEYLLIKRTGEPLKGQWWVIGGRVQKGETMEQAAVRKVKEEAALSVGALRPVGYYEEVYQDAPFGVKSGLHAVSVVFSTICEQEPAALDYQASEWKYSKDLPKDFRVIPFNGG